MNDEARDEYSTGQTAPAAEAAPSTEAAPAPQRGVEQENQNPVAEQTVAEKPVAAKPAAKSATKTPRRAASSRSAAAKAAKAQATDAQPVAVAEPVAAAVMADASTTVEPTAAQTDGTPSASIKPAAIVHAAVESTPVESSSANPVATNAVADHPVTDQAVTGHIAVADDSQTSQSNQSNGQRNTPADDHAPNPAQNNRDITRNSMDNQPTTEMNEANDGAASRSVRLPEVREDRDARPVESRGLRFRGRDGRAEVRGRVLARGRRPQGGGQNGGGQNVATPGGTRDDAYSDGAGNGFGTNGRAGQQGGRDNNNRDNNNRDNSRDGGGRDGNNRDGNNRDGRERVLERDVVRGRNDLDLLTLEDKNLTELRDIAKDLNVTATAAMKKSDLVLRILEAQAAMSGNAFKRGILEILPMAKAFCAPKATCRATKTYMCRKARSSGSTCAPATLCRVRCVLLKKWSATIAYFVSKPPMASRRTSRASAKSLRS
jgi:hypothetical protein